MEQHNRVYLTREFNCSIAELFRWIVEPGLISQWFGPKNLNVGKVENNLEVGGRYSIELVRPDRSSFFIRGQYLEIEQPAKLAFDFEYVGMASSPPKSIVRINLDEIHENRTRLALVQQFDTRPSDMETRTQAWVHMLSVLQTLVTT